MLAACGSGSTAITGTLNGAEPQAHYAIASYASSDTIGGAVQIPNVFLSTRDDMCTLLQKGQFTKNTDVVEILLLANTTTDGIPHGPGVFPVVQIPNPASNPNLFSVITAGTTNNTPACFDAVYNTAMQGSVSISQLGSRQAPTLGSFDATFLGGELSGYFYALPCIVPATSEDGEATCH